MAEVTVHDDVLIALRGGRPGRLPHWGDDSFVVADWPGRKPPVSGVDDWGVTWAPLPDAYVIGPDEPAQSFPVAHPIGIEELAGLAAPGLRPIERFEAGDRAIIAQHPAGPLDRFLTLLGAEQAYLALGRASDACGRALLCIAEYHGAVAHALLAAGAHAGFVADDYAGQTGPLISPRLWRRIVLPAIASVLAVYRDAGAPVIFHTCGTAEPFIGDLIEAGATAFNLQTELNDPVALRRRFGSRIAFYGGVPARVMLQGSPEEVARAVRSAIETIGREGGFLLAPDQPLAYSEENRAAFRSAAAKSVS